VINTAFIKETAIILAALGAIGTAAWAFGTATGYRPALISELHESESKLVQSDKNTEQTLENLSNAMLLIRLQLLMKERELGGLSFQDQQELCRIARILSYVGVPGC